MSRFDFRSALSIDVAGSSPRPGSPWQPTPAAARSSRDSELRSARGHGDVRPGVRRVGCCVRPDSADAEAIDTASDYAQTQRASAVLGSFTGKRLHLVQFAGPVRQQWVDSLAADGLRIVNYIPDNAYLVWGDAAAIAQLQARARTAASSVQWDGAWKAEYKVHPAVWAARRT